jgi:lipopolysaccharide export system protein LptC
MMGLLAMSSAGLVGVFAYNSGMFTPERKPTPPAQEVQVSQKSVRMMAPKVTGFDRKAQAYQINAESARQDEAEPHIVHMETVTADLRLKKSGDVVQVTADRGVYDNDGETLQLDGNVVVTSASGYTANLERASVWMKEGRVASDRPVMVTAPTGTIVANGLEMWNDGANIRFLDRARMVFRGDKKDAG